MSTDVNTVSEYLRAHRIRELLDDFMVDYTRQLHNQHAYVTQAQRYAAPTPATQHHETLTEPSGDRAHDTRAPVLDPAAALRAFLSHHRASAAAAAAAQTYALILIETDSEDAHTSQHAEYGETHEIEEAAQKLATELAARTDGFVQHPPNRSTTTSTRRATPPSRHSDQAAMDVAATHNTEASDDPAGQADAAAGASWAYEQDEAQTRLITRTRAFMASSLRAQQQQQKQRLSHSGARGNGPMIVVSSVSHFPSSVGDAIALEQVFGEGPRAVLVLQRPSSSEPDAADAEAQQHVRRRLASGGSAAGWMQDLSTPQQLLVLSRALEVQQALLIAGSHTATAGQDEDSRRETTEAFASLEDAKARALYQYYECRDCLQMVSASEWRDEKYMRSLVEGFIAALRPTASS